jgi:catechol 2,3-dioxygenase-like lactoylglutathione lyase family enzyme
MLSRIDHINIVVTDLDRMIEFYTRLLGLTLTRHVTISGDWVAATVGLASVHADVVYLDLPEGPRVELIRYNVPTMDRPENIDKPNAPGLRHFAFAVTDIEAIVGRLGERGVKFFGDIQTVPETQVTYAGGVRKRIVYFQDPEGNLLELCEYR